MPVFGDLQVSAELLPATQREHRRVTTELRSWRTWSCLSL